MNILDFLDFEPKVGCEVGVFSWGSCVLKEILPKLDKLILVEPNEILINEMETAWSDIEKVYFHNVAIGPYDGSVSLVSRKHSYEGDMSAFISLIDKPPCVSNEGYQLLEEDLITVPMMRFSLIDPGNIDLLSLDCEGSEYYVLQTLKSRPKLIGIETHYQNYQNPFLTEILNWMNKNKYLKIGDSNADSYYRLKDEKS